MSPTADTFAVVITEYRKGKRGARHIKYEVNVGGKVFPFSTYGAMEDWRIKQTWTGMKVERRSVRR